MNHSVRKMCRSQAIMERPCVKLILTFYCGMLFIQKNVESARPGRLFVIGDSYVDTGNLNKSNPNWKPPYGISFAGKPSGRYSDGKVLTDFIASAFNTPTPVPYNQRDSYPVQQLCFGMNFAVGGSGVFETWPGLSSMTTQIDQLQRLMMNGIYSANDIEFSLLLFAVSGNDYGFYILQQKPIECLPSFVESVIKQLSADLVRLYNMGFRRFALTDMEPLGCLPYFTADNSYRSCNATINTISLSHNFLLRETVEGIRKIRADANFVILDQYSDVMAIFQRPTHYGKFKEPLTPCCTGQCGVTDSAGKALYSVCAHPESAFFWDKAHPTQAEEEEGRVDEDQQGMQSNEETLVHDDAEAQTTGKQTPGEDTQTNLENLKDASASSQEHMGDSLLGKGTQTALVIHKEAPTNGFK